jgi:hypothetical protein
MVKLPALKSGSDVIRWFKVPQKWHDHRKHVSDLHSRIRQDLHESPGVFETRLIRSSKTYGGNNGLQIEVLIDPEMGAKSAIPSSSENISIKSTHNKERDTSAACSDPNGDDNCTNYEDDDWVKAGEVVGDYSRYGTASGRVQAPNGNRLLTCAHTFYYPGNCGSASLGGNSAYVDGDPNDNQLNWHGQRVGEVNEHDIGADYVFIEKDGTGSTWGSKIDNNRSSVDSKIVGYCTKDYLADKASLHYNSPCFNKMGVTTGLRSGKVYAVEADDGFNSCTNYSNEGVKSTIPSADGDSGGPVYLRTNRGEFLANINQAGYDSTTNYACGNTVYSKCGGTAAYEIKNRESCQFGTGSEGGLE